MTDKKKVNLALIVAALALIGVLGVAIFGGKTTTTKTVQKVYGGITNYSEVAMGDGSESWVMGSIGTASTYTCLQIPKTDPFTASTLFIDYGEMGVPFGSTASTSYQMYVFATTSATVPASYDFLATYPERASTTILAITTFATSTTATTTSTLTQAAQRTALVGTVMIPPSQVYYVCGFLKALSNSRDAAGNFTPATSTSAFSGSGARPFFNVHYHRVAPNTP